MSAKKTVKNTKKKPGANVPTWVIVVVPMLIVALLIFSAVYDPKPKPAVVDQPTVFTPTHVADIAIREMGVIRVELDGNAAPETVKNFVTLAESGFYDNLTFHRIIDGFMMQGGDPKGNGFGGSGTSIKGEFVNNGVPNTLSHTRGAISMARSQEYDSASSQFFIVHQDACDDLDGDYAVFGYVSEGMEIVDEICANAKPMDKNGLIAVENRPRIETITISEYKE